MNKKGAAVSNKNGERKLVSQKILGNRIRRIRKELEMTQTELGEKIGVSFVTVSNWETGKHKPEMEQLKKVAEQANIELDTLLYNNTIIKVNKVVNEPAKVESKAKEVTAVKTKAVKSVEPVKAATPAKKAVAVKKEKSTEPVNKLIKVRQRDLSKTTSPVVQASSVVALQLEDELTTLLNGVSKAKQDELLKQAERITVYNYAMKGIRSRIKTKKSSAFVYLGKNSILDKFFEYHMKNPFKAVTDDTIEGFERTLEAVYNG